MWRHIFKTFIHETSLPFFFFFSDCIFTCIYVFIGQFEISISFVNYLYILLWAKLFLTWRKYLFTWNNFFRVFSWWIIFWMFSFLQQQITQSDPNQHSDLFTFRFSIGFHCSNDSCAWSLCTVSFPPCVSLQWHVFNGPVMLLHNKTFF